MHLSKVILLNNGVEASINKVKFIDYNIIDEITYISISSYLNLDALNNDLSPLMIDTITFPFPKSQISNALIDAEGDLELAIYTALLLLPIFTGGSIV